MPRLNLMSRYPSSNREAYVKRSNALTESEILISKKFDQDYFDGDRRYGLGGYYYDPKFFTPVVEDMVRYYELDNNSSVLDVGCAKGFMMHDFMLQVPGIRIAGIDISNYCYRHAISTAKPFITLGSCDQLPWKNQSFDLVVSIATIHNLDIDGVKRSLEEIIRVTRKNAFIRVNGYSNNEELNRLLGWNLVANTILHHDEWLELFAQVGYSFDYDFFVP